MDLRSYIADLEKTGDVVRIKDQVDWDAEAGAIVRRACETNSPAPLMENIKDYPGQSLLGCPVATYRRLAVTMGLSPDLSIPDLAKEYMRLTSRPVVKPVVVKDGPCKENKFFGDDVDLFSLPVPMVHAGDGGRYIGTWHIVVTKDPDTNLVNWGVYRNMVHSRNLMNGLIMPTSDAGKALYQKFQPQGKSMPFAICIGNHPLAPFVGSAPLAGEEPDIMGAITGKPVELVKCETVDLEVPASTEIVIEGEVLSNVKLPEGPFGEYVGYRTSPRDYRAVYKVNCITHRNNPIMTMANMGMPTDEGQLIRSFTLALEMRRLLEREGIPITNVYMYPESTHHLVVVGVKPIYHNIANQIGALIFGSKLTPWFYYCFVVDEDVDVYNWKELMHAFSTKCHPGRDITIIDRSPGNPVTPFLTMEERSKGLGAKVIFDCTTPVDWPKETVRPMKVSFKNPDCYPAAVQERVLANWTKWGMKD